MSELIQKNDNRATIRWKLLTSASALALTAYVAAANVARADDTDHPTIWIELGGEMDHATGQGAPFAPAFLSVYPTSSVLEGKTTPLQAQKPAIFGFGEDGRISFQPQDSDWIFSAAIRIGRSSSNRRVDHQTSGIHYSKYQSGVPTNGIFPTELFANTKVQRHESHAILDFAAGKDVGLGLFGRDASSTLSLGVRFAQFTSSQSMDIRARPDLQFKYLSLGSNRSWHRPYFHTYHASGNASRNFRGLGPSLSWTGSAPFAGNAQDGEIAIDWGVNAALLFGKQKARVHHQQTGHYVSFGAGIFNSSPYVVLTPTAGGHDKMRNVTVPNAGGSIGISFRRGDAKVSFGYRADFFFGAMDTGIDTRKSSNMLFHGPYASISIGIGD